MQMIGNTVHDQCTPAYIPDDPPYICMQLFAKLFRNAWHPLFGAENDVRQQIRECLCHIS